MMTGLNCPFKNLQKEYSLNKEGEKSHEKIRENQAHKFTQINIYIIPGIIYGSLCMQPHTWLELYSSLSPSLLQCFYTKASH